MEKIVIGKIEEHDVLYLPEKDLVFCKNTVLPFSLAKEIQKTSLDRMEYPEKNLDIRIFDNSIELGCLTTSRENFNYLIKQIKKIKHDRD